jgi:phosphoribosylformylglycinamidine cyclo-ligase
VPAIFQILQDRGAVPPNEMYQVFNMGIGMVAIVSARDAKPVAAALQARPIGRIEKGSRRTRLVN